MKISAIVEQLLTSEPKDRPTCGRNHHPAVQDIVARLLEDKSPAPPALQEASVHAGRRSRIFVATFTGPQGGQIWHTTGLTDRDQALKLAQEWEAQARMQRALFGARPRKSGLRVHRTQPTTGIGLLTQKEVAELLNMSERGVREVERRALAKLRRHPLLRQLWQDYSSSKLEEAQEVFTSAEILGLFDLAMNPQELRLIEKVLSAVYR